MILYIEYMNTDIDQYCIVSTEPFSGDEEYYFERTVIKVNNWSDVFESLCMYTDLIQGWDFMYTLAYEFSKRELTLPRS